MTATAEGPMVRRNDGTAKVDTEILRKAKIVAAHKDVPLAEYLSAVLGPIVDRDLEHYSRLALGEGKKKGKGGE